MTDIVHNRLNPPMYQKFNIFSAGNYASFLAYLAPNSPLMAKGKRQEGDIILDIATGTELVCYFSEGSDVFRWQGRGGCRVESYLATTAIVKNRLVLLTSAFHYSEATARGQRCYGIAMNSAAIGERVYIMTEGHWIVEEGADPPNVADYLVCAANGTTDTPVGGDFQHGWITALGLVVNDGVGNLTVDTAEFRMAVQTIAGP